MAGDSVPGKYQLAEHSGLCVSCMVQTVVTSVLGGRKGHIILLTRGSQDSLSLTDEEVISSLVTSTGLTLSSVLLPSLSSGSPLPCSCSMCLCPYCYAYLSIYMCVLLSEKD